MNITQLGISIATDQIRAGLRELDKIEKAANSTADAADRVGRESEQAFKKTTRGASEAARAYQGVDAAAKSAFTSMQSGASGAGQALDRLQRILIGGFAGGVVAGNIIGAADAYTKLTAQIKIATTGAEQFNQAYGQVIGITRESQGDLEAVSALYTRIANSTKEAGVSLAQVGDITKTVSLGLKLSGASAQEASSTMLQLSQAFASGVLRGEEFNAVSEAAFPLMNALAKSMGVPIESLREMASQGLITRDAMVKAFTDPELIKTFEAQAREVQNVSSAFQLLKTDLTLMVGELDKTTGASKALAGVIKDMADFINGNTDGIITFFEVLSGGAVVGGLALAAGNIGKVTTAVEALTVAGLAAAKNPIILAIFGLASLAAAAAYAEQQTKDIEKTFTTQTKIAELARKIAESEKFIAEARSSGGNRIAAINEQQRLNRMLEEYNSLVLEGNITSNQSAENRAAEFAAMQKDADEVIKTLQTETKVNEALDNLRKKSGKTGEEAYKRILAEATRYLESIQSVIDKEAMRGEALKQQLLLGRELTDSEKQHIENVQKFGAAVANGLKDQAEANDLLEKKIEALKDLEKANKKALEDARKENDSITEGNKKLEEEIEKIGLKSSALAELEAQYAATAAQAARMGAEEAFQRGDDALGQTFLKRAEELEKRVLLLRKKGAKEAAQAIVEENQKANLALVDDIVKTFGDIASRGGKEAGKNIVKAIQVELQKSVFRVAVQAALGVDAKGNATGGGLIGAGSSLLGDVSKSFLQDAIKGGFTSALSSAAGYAAAVPGLTSAAAGSQAALLAAQTGSFGAAGTAATAAAGGSAVGGFASSALAAAPYVAVAVLAYQLFKSKKISASSLGGADVLFSGQGQELGVSTGQGGADNEFARSIITPLKDQYVGLTKALGGVQQAFTLTAVGNTGRQGENPNFAIKFGVNNQTFSSTNGEVALNEANVGTESLRALIGLLAQTDLPDNIDAIVRGLDLTNASLADLEATLGLVQAVDFVNDSFGLLGNNLGMLANASSEAIVQFFQAVGGLDSLSASLGNFNDKFLTDAEKQSLLLGQVSKAFAQLTIELPKSREEFKRLVQSQDLLSASGAQTYASLLNLTDSIDALYPVVDAAATATDNLARSAEQIANERVGLENQLLQLQGNTVELRRRELEALDPSNRAIQEMIYNLEDQRAASERAKDAEEDRIRLAEQAANDARQAFERLANAGRSIKDVINQITLSLTNSPASRTLGAGALFEQQLGLARGNDTNALGSIGGAATAAIDAARSSSRSFVEFQRAALSIRADLQSLPAVKTFEDSLLGLIQDILTAVKVTPHDLLLKFDLFDSSFDGLLSFDELKLALEGKATDAEIQRLITESDLNFDGLLSRLELLSTATVLGFNKLDTTANGLLDFNELKASGLATDAEIRNLINITDQNSDQMISQFELQFTRLAGESQSVKNAVANGFTALDTTTNGLLDFTEFKNGLVGLASDSTLQNIFTELDINGDGMISKIEGTNARLDGLAGAIRANLAPLFDMIDTNVSGGISQAEFTTAFSSFGLGEKLNSIFSEIDVNGDGTITRLEAGNVKTDSTNSLLFEVQQMALRSAGSGIYVRASTDDRWNDALYRLANRAEGAGGGTVMQGPLTNGTLSVQSFNRTGQASFFADGGYVSGPGTNRSDSINARLSNGEFVQPASAVNQFGRGFMESIRRGEMPMMRPMIAGIDMSGMLAELRALRSEVSNLRAENSRENYAIAKNTMNVANRLERFDDGDRLRVTIEQDTGETVNVTVVP